MNQRTEHFIMYFRQQKNEEEFLLDSIDDAIKINNRIISVLNVKLLFL